MNHVYSSILFNYKSWIFILLSIYFLERDNYFPALITFCIMMFLAYYIHYCSHLDYWFPYNLTHIEHHCHNNWFSHCIEILLEFSIFMIAITVKYVFGLTFCNEWIIIYFYLFYTTVHNVNYSIFHVNRIHEKHHESMTFNYGPDIFDIIFNTKKNPESDLENTDHYIWNILVLTPIVYGMKTVYNNSTDQWKRESKYIIGIIFTIVTTILVCSTADLYIDSCGKHTPKNAT